MPNTAVEIAEKKGVDPVPSISHPLKNAVKGLATRPLDKKLAFSLNAAWDHEANGLPCGYRPYVLLCEESLTPLSDFASSYMNRPAEQSRDVLFNQYPAMFVLKAKTIPAASGGTSKVSAVKAAAISLVLLGPIAAGVMSGIFHWVLKLMRAV